MRQQRSAEPKQPNRVSLSLSIEQVRAVERQLSGKRQSADLDHLIAVQALFQARLRRLEREKDAAFEASVFERDLPAIVGEAAAE